MKASWRLEGKGGDSKQKRDHATAGLGLCMLGLSLSWSDILAEIEIVIGPGLVKEA